MILCIFKFSEVASCDFADLLAEILVAFDFAGANLVIVVKTVGLGTEVKVGVAHHRHLGVIAGIFGKQTAEHLERNASVMESVILTNCKCATTAIVVAERNGPRFLIIAVSSGKF